MSICVASVVRGPIEFVARDILTCVCDADVGRRVRQRHGLLGFGLRGSWVRGLL